MRSRTIISHIITGASLRGPESATGHPYRLRPFTNNYCAKRGIALPGTPVDTSGRNSTTHRRLRLRASFALSVESLWAEAKLGDSERKPRVQFPSRRIRKERIDEHPGCTRSKDGTNFRVRVLYIAFGAGGAQIRRGASLSGLGKVFSASFITALLIDACSNSFLYFSFSRRRPPLSLEVQSSARSLEWKTLIQKWALEQSGRVARQTDGPEK